MSELNIKFSVINRVLHVVGAYGGVTSVCLCVWGRCSFGIPLDLAVVRRPPHLVQITLRFIVYTMVVLILDAILHFLGTMKGEYLCVCDDGRGGGAKYSG